MRTLMNFLKGLGSAAIAIVVVAFFIGIVMFVGPMLGLIGIGIAAILAIVVIGISIYEEVCNKGP